MDEKTRFIKERRSVRRYKADPVPEGILRDILDCARLAPTANNKQPWLMGAVTDPGLRKGIAALADYGKFIADAPVCFAVFARKDEKYYLEDGSGATVNILLAARAHGLGTCWVAGDKKTYAGPVRELLGVPVEFTLVSLIACGYPAEAPSPRKKPLSEVTFRDRFQGGGGP